jgi:phosphoserine phosphatase
MDDGQPAPIAATRGGAAGDGCLPLVVDLDGTLVRTDTTLECAAALAGRPLRLLPAILSLRRGRAAVKQLLAAAADLDPARLPYNAALLAYLRQQQEKARLLVLATGADRRIAEAVAQHLGLFDTVLASDGRINLTGRAKLAAIRDRLEGAPFTYVGNSRTDLAIWGAAAAGICVNASPRVVHAAARATRIERTFAADSVWLTALLYLRRSSG